MRARILTFVGICGIAIAVTGVVRGDPPPITLEVGPGVDLFRCTGGSVTVNLPAGFFGPGSPAWAGAIPLQGLHLGTGGPWELGTSDVVLARRSTLAMTDAPSTATSHVKVYQMSLRGTGVFSIQVNGQQTTWTVTVGIDGDQPFPLGTFDLSRSAVDAGTFSANLPLRPVVRFRRGQTVLSHALGLVTLSATDGAWTPMSSSPLAGLAQTRLPIGLSLACDLAGPGLSLGLAPAGTDPSAPGPASISPSAIVDPTAKLGRNCTIGDGAVIGADVIVGPGVSVGANSVLGAGSLIGGGTVLGSSVSIGAGTFVSNVCQLDANATVGADSHVEPAVLVGAGASIGSGCLVGESSVLGASSTLGDGARVFRSVTLGTGATVLATIEVASGVNVLANTTVADPVVVTWDLSGGRGTTALSAPTVDLVYTTASPVVGSILPSILASLTPIDPANPPPGVDIEKLKNDVGGGTARPTCGGSGMPYLPQTFDCEDFAEDLRQRLAGLGYSTTFTFVRHFHKNPDYGWWDKYGFGSDPEWIEEPENNHCLVDVHLGGKVIWIEAQRIGAEGVGEDLDANHDGHVDTADRPGTEPTEGTTRVEVYDSQEDATNKGCNWD